MDKQRKDTGLQQRGVCDKMRKSHFEYDKDVGNDKKVKVGAAGRQ